MLHPHQRIWKATVPEALNGHLYPVQELCCHLIILFLHAINLHQDPYDLCNRREDHNYVCNEDGLQAKCIYMYTRGAPPGLQ